MTYRLDGIDSDQSKDIRARNHTRTLFLQLLLNLVDDEKVRQAEVVGRVLLRLVHFGGVQKHGTVTPLHKAVMEKQTQLRSRTSGIQFKFCCYNFLHNLGQLRTRLVVKTKFQRRHKVSSSDRIVVTVFSQISRRSRHKSKVSSFSYHRERGHNQPKNKNQKNNQIKRNQFPHSCTTLITTTKKTKKKIAVLRRHRKLRWRNVTLFF